MLIEVFLKENKVGTLMDVKSIEYYNGITVTELRMKGVSYPRTDSFNCRVDEVEHIVLCSPAMTNKEQQASELLYNMPFRTSILMVEDDLKKVKRILARKRRELLKSE